MTKGRGANSPHRHGRAPIPDLIGDDPAIHVLLCDRKKTWMRGSSPRMTIEKLARAPE
jgi:hypothetical protein